MSEKVAKIYPKGLLVFPKNEKAPDFVKGSMVVNPNQLVSWLKENESLMTEYKGEKQLRLQILENDKGLYLVVDTFKPKKDDLPF